MADSSILDIEQLSFPWKTLDPFLFSVHHDDRYPSGNDRLGPAASLSGRNLGMDFEGKDGWSMYHGHIVPGFPQHPHRGFETITIARKGLIDHSDSLGATARFGGGDVQWMTAGRGIEHAEMFPLLDKNGGNHLELFQIWLNLPRASKMVAPHFSMLWSETIPSRTVGDSEGKKTTITVIAGRYETAQAPPPPPKSWASDDSADVAIWTIKMEAGARFTLPSARKGSNRALFFFAGESLKVDGRDVPSSHRVVVRADAKPALEAGPGGVEMLLLQGRPIGEPVVHYGPFVMNTREEIQQAMMDYRATRFGGWPWGSAAPVHAREKGRFALHADGKVDKPA
jgi:redox-sensitive bicupin YhaK (pirin superfamily)